MDALRYRPLEEKDLDEMRQLHVEWFPLKYAESFYSSAVKGKYFSLVATFEWEGREVRSKDTNE